MRKGVIITFDISPKRVPRKDIVNLHRKLYGYKDHSQHGKYEYHRPGLLDKIPHLNPSRSVIITFKKDALKIINLLKNYTDQIFTREVLLTKKDLEAMRSTENINSTEAKR